jgi:hypothetical protein
VEQRGDAAGLPGFVISEFERYLACGILAHGFARVRCTCGGEMLVAYANDREGLAHLCGYGARPPLAQSRLSQLPMDGSPIA